MEDSILRLQNITKSFGSVIAADDLSLVINQGEFFTLLGPSGSGKSSILRAIAGLQKLDAGQIYLRGEEISAVPPWKRNLGMVFQDYAVFPHMNVAENVGYGLRIANVNKTTVRKKVSELLALVGLTGKENQSAVTLSGGEKQRVALARALALEPTLLLLDEPLSALDEKIRREMQQELKSIQRKTGTTFIYVTHDQEEALTMSDRIAVINNGKCIQCDLPEVLFRKPKTRFVASFFRGCNIIRSEFLGIRDGHVTCRIGNTNLSLEVESTASKFQPTLSLAVRAESLFIGQDAEDCDLSFQVSVQNVIYRGTNIDYLVEFEDGQQATATTTRRCLAPGERETRVGIFPHDVVILDD